MNSVPVSVQAKTRKWSNIKMMMETEKEIYHQLEVRGELLFFQELIRTRRKLEAVKLVKDATNMGLKDAKDFVDQVSVMGMGDKQATGSSFDFALVAELLEAGKKLEAIKALKDATGMGLKEAKDFVEALEHNAASGEPVQYQSRSSESVSVRSDNGGIRVTYTKPDGLKMDVTPQSPEWADVKRLMPDHKMIERYEAAYHQQAGAIETTDIDRLLQEQAPKRAVWPRYLILILVLLVFAYFFFIK